MNNPELVDKIEHAKDGFGVIAPSALHDQLSNMTEADWKQAAVLYSKDSTKSNGFYIEDDKNGKIVIHNDLTEARKFEKTGALGATLNDAKTIAAYAIGADLTAATFWGSVETATTFSLASNATTGLLASEFVGSACFGAVVFGGVIAGVAAVALAGDIALNSIKIAKAHEDVSIASEVTAFRK